MHSDPGRCSGFRRHDQRADSAPSHFVSKQWPVRSFPGYSGGTTRDLHPLPFTRIDLNDDLVSDRTEGTLGDAGKPCQAVGPRSRRGRVR